MKRSFLYSLLGVVIAASLLSGCGGKDIHPVDGQVVWKDGKPAKELAGSIVMFENAEKKTSSRGQIDADGNFRLTTEKENDGAPAGEHTVLVIEVGRQAQGGPEGTNIAPAKVNTRYMTPSTSDLKATIKPGDNKITLTVEP